MSSTQYFFLVASAWYFINGLLHDLFVIKNHKGKYDRELLRLLMDGHVLILSGAIEFVCWMMIQHQEIYGAIISMIVGFFMLIYCIMIFPFLKSIVTILISILLIILSMIYTISNPGI